MSNLCAKYSYLLYLQYMLPTKLNQGICPIKLSQMKTTHSLSSIFLTATLFIPLICLSFETRGRDLSVQWDILLTAKTE